MGRISSYLKAIRASRYFGEALKCEKKGCLEKSLKKAHDGLNILSSSGVMRNSPAESSVLVGLTILVEEVSNKLHCVGACEKDLVDTYLSIKDLEGTEIFNEYIDWLQYIENKLGYVPTKS